MRTIGFFVKEGNGTKPLRVDDPEPIVSLLLQNSPIEHKGTRYSYNSIRIRNENISIFITKID